MMKGGKVILWILGISLVIGGCVTSRNIVVEIHDPPRIPLPENVKNVTLVIRVPGEVRKETKGMVVCRDIGDPSCFLLAGEKALLGFSERIYEESTLNVNNIIELADSGMASRDTVVTPLTDSDLERFCNPEGEGTLLVTIGSVKMQKEIEYSSRETYPHEARNKVWSKTILYNVQPVWLQQAKMKVAVNNGWRIYDCNTKQIIFEGNLKDSVLYKVDGATREEVRKKLPSFQTSAERVGFVAGWDFAAWVLPVSTTVERKYFGSSRPFLRRATRYVKFRQWEEAEKEWQHLLPASERKTKARILYNLALARERNGDYEKALAYIREAEQLHPSPEIKAYKKILERERSKREK